LPYKKLSPIIKLNAFVVDKEDSTLMQKKNKEVVPDRGKYSVKLN
jgi:hypothetical protein